VGFGLLVVLGGYAIISAHFRRVGLMAPDESYYTLAARYVYEGRVPYRDFAYMQMPYLPYINGLVMWFIGFGMDSHRLVSSIWGGIGLIALIAAVRQRLGKWEPALLAAFAFGVSPRWGFLQSMGVWCGATGMFLNLALAVVLWRGSLLRRATLFALFGTLSVGCRLSCLPIVATIALLLLVECPDWRYRAKVLAICLGVGLLSILPFVALAPDAFLFMNWQYHMASQASRPFVVKLFQAWDVAPASFVVLAIGFLGLPRLLRQKKWTESILLGAGLVGLIAVLAPASAWGVYVSASVPIAAVAGIVAIWSSGMAEGNPFRHIIWAFPIMSLFHPTSLEVAEGAATEVEEIGAFIRNEVEEGPVLTPANIIAVEAGRDALPGTEMGKFAAMFPWDEPRANRYHMTTLPLLISAVENSEPAAIILIHQPEGWLVWNFQMGLPAMQKQPYPLIQSFRETVETCYRVAWRTSTMEVFVRRTE
jgi:hypothetical protein